MSVTPFLIYLAGPGVFLRDPFAEAKRLKSICARYGAQGLFPMDNELTVQANPRGVARAIRIANEAMIARCDAVIADMRPFRGPGMDGGTAYEIGFARALGKIIVGYSADQRTYEARVAGATREADGTLWDPAGLAVEDFGLVDNLMMAEGIDALADDAEAAIGCAVAMLMAAPRVTAAG